MYCPASCKDGIIFLPNEANERSELSSEVNKLNSNSPKEKNKTCLLPCEASSLNSNLLNKANETSK